MTATWIDERARALVARDITHLTEWPTWFVAAAVYGGWLLLTYYWSVLPWFVVLPAGAWLAAWHHSLQHETVHGHPSRNEKINAALGYAPLSLWMPWPIYRDTHIAHHHDDSLTDPARDPESFYIGAEEWAALEPWQRHVLRYNNTLAGRLLLGPALMVGRFWHAELRDVFFGRGTNLNVWLWHLVAVALVLVWALGVCGIPAWQYALLFVYPGLSLTLLRSFAEHRAAESPSRRSAQVNAHPLLGLLYLSNNLHVVHHARPDLAWYQVPEYRDALKGTLPPHDAKLVYPGYGAIFRRYLFRAHDVPVNRYLAG